MTYRHWMVNHQAAINEIYLLQTRIEELESVLRMVKADRPTAHSDEVWLAVCEAIDGSD